MTPLSFEQYWREFGKLEHEVIKNCSPNSELEKDFYNFAKKVWEQNEQRIDNEIESYKKNFRENALQKLIDRFENFVDDCLEEIE